MYSEAGWLKSGAKVPPGAYCYGIDISHYQPGIEWDSLRVMTDARRFTTRSKLHAKDIKPVSFVFIKATEGSAMKDKKFRKHWDNAEKAGIRKVKASSFVFPIILDIAIDNDEVAIAHASPSNLISSTISLSSFNSIVK